MKDTRYDECSRLGLNLEGSECYFNEQVDY